MTWRRILRTEKLHINSIRSLAYLAVQSQVIVALFGSLQFMSHQIFLGIITVGSLSCISVPSCRARASCKTFCRAWPAFMRIYNDMI